MPTVDTSTKVFVYCNRCHADTAHASQGECSATNRAFDASSQTDVQFIDTYTLLQCEVCGEARLRLIAYNSENDESPPRYFPPPVRCYAPYWLQELEEPLLCALLTDVYAALNAEMYPLALMGVRAALDVWVSSQTSDRNNFAVKLRELRELRILSDHQAEVLHTLFDAGSAAAHRGYRPNRLDAIAATEAAENFFHHQVLLPRIANLKKNTPPRARR